VALSSKSDYLVRQPVKDFFLDMRSVWTSICLKAFYWHHLFLFNAFNAHFYSQFLLEIMFMIGFIFFVILIFS
jgi:hypothetical protein